jgi:formimidoylglutamate deiminase
VTDLPPLLAPFAWVERRWRGNVLLERAGDGTWSKVTPECSQVPAGAIRLPGPALPGLVDAHSHAFQRAFAGLAEFRGPGDDDFWSWRDRMYTVALAVTPDELRAIATRLYRELLRGGYTQVCEFHYLHRAPDGRFYDDRLAMSRALCEAAADAGIGLTLLPVLYQRAGFGESRLRDDQRRFATTVDDVLELRDGVRQLGLANVSAGVAMHSLRAAAPESMLALAEACADDPAPIHLHVAEQQREVDDCLAHTGARPIQWLCDNLPLDARWHLVHATHTSAAELDALAERGAGVVLCPTTEANLGDGLPDLAGMLDRDIPISIGSDSQVTRDWREELRLAEYGQRLAWRRRNIAALAGGSTAERLFTRALEGGAAAAGFGRWGLRAGARADLVVVDPDDDALRDVPRERWLDALVFVSPGRPFREVWVAGTRRDPSGA